MAGIEINAGVINYGGVPLAGAGLLANRPAFGVTGRLYIGTDTNLIYRDTGSAWVSISGSGTITGSGTAGQATFWSGASAISGDNAFFWDNTNKRLGLGTTTPGVRLDVHGTGVIQQLNGTTTNNAYLDFQNAGTTQWRIGNLYNTGLQNFSIINAGLSTIFTILQNGNIGINNTNPNIRLTVDGGSGFITPLWVKSSFLSVNKYYSGMIVGYDIVVNQSTAFGYVYDSITPANSYSHLTPYGIGEGLYFAQKVNGFLGLGGYTNPQVQLAVNGSIYQGSNTANSNFQLLCSANFYTGGFSPNFFTYTAGPVSIPLTNTGLVFKTAATITATLPLASGINNQYYIVVLAGTVVTLNRSGSDNIINTLGTTVTSLTLTGYTKTLLYSDGGTTWYQLF